MEWRGMDLDRRWQRQRQPLAVGRREYHGRSDQPARSRLRGFAVQSRRRRPPDEDQQEHGGRYSVARVPDGLFRPRGNGPRRVRQLLLQGFGERLDLVRCHSDRPHEWPGVVSEHDHRRRRDRWRQGRRDGLGRWRGVDDRRQRRDDGKNKRRSGDQRQARHRCDRDVEGPGIGGHGCAAGSDTG